MHEKQITKTSGLMAHACLLFDVRWDGLKNFTNSRRVPLYCSGGEAAGTQAFLKSYKNLKFYWILGAGHMVSSSNL
jgi:serine carboxypeptidase 1